MAERLLEIRGSSDGVRILGFRTGPTQGKVVAQFPTSDYDEEDARRLRVLWNLAEAAGVPTEALEAGTLELVPVGTLARLEALDHAITGTNVVLTPDTMAAIEEWTMRNPDVPLRLREGVLALLALRDVALRPVPADANPARDDLEVPDAA